MALNAQILLSILAHESDAGDISRTLRATPATYALELTDGTGANQAQVVWSDSRTIAADDDDTITIDLLGDDRGNVSMTAIKAIYIRNTGSIQIDWMGGGWGSSPFEDITTGRLRISAGSGVLMTNPSATGWGVSGDPGTQTIIIENQSTTVAATYDIILIGEGAIT